MTRDEIMQMEAGREMDKLVARAMGLDWFIGHNRQVVVSHPDTAYSTSIAAAWQVVEKLPYFSLHRLPKGKYQCQSRFCGDWFDHPTSACKCVYANADTAPLAICKAALLTTVEGQ